MGEAVKKRSTEKSPCPVAVGHRYYYHYRDKDTVRVMAVSEDWAMVRYPRAIPFVVRCEELWRRHRATMEEAEKGNTE